LRVIDLMVHCVFVTLQVQEPQMERISSVLGVSSVRESKGITLEQIADQTKISIRLLRAIEVGQFKKLPGGIYNTNYIRQYARAIEFDESELLAYYHANSEVNPPAASPPRQAGRSDGGSLHAMSTLLGL
jgi:cytoskeletal protein RodZ